MNKDKLRSIRLYLNMSQAEFAKHIGVADSTVSMIETGDREVSDKVAARVARKFTVTTDFIDYVENREKLR